jgi:DNA-binding protein HU-beta
VKRSQLIKQIAAELGETPAVAEKSLNAVLSVLGEAMVNEDTIKLRNVGTFHIQRRPARSVRHSQSGEIFISPPAVIVSFDPASRLRKLMADSPGVVTR